MTIACFNDVLLNTPSLRGSFFASRWRACRDSLFTFFKSCRWRWEAGLTHLQAGIVPSTPSRAWRLPASTCGNSSERGEGVVFFRDIRRHLRPGSRRRAEIYKQGLSVAHAHSLASDDFWKLRLIVGETLPADLDVIAFASFADCSHD